MSEGTGPSAGNPPVDEFKRLAEQGYYTDTCYGFTGGDLIGGPAFRQVSRSEARYSLEDVQKMLNDAHGFVAKRGLAALASVEKERDAQERRADIVTAYLDWLLPRRKEEKRDLASAREALRTVKRLIPSWSAIAQIIDAALGEGAPSAAPPDRWQPIETAPEATYVLVWLPNAGIHRATRTGRDWWDGEEAIYPSHWMPEPAPPAAPPEPVCGVVALDGIVNRIGATCVLARGHLGVHIWPAPHAPAPTEAPSDHIAGVGNMLDNGTRITTQADPPQPEPSWVDRAADALAHALALNLPEDFSREESARRIATIIRKHAPSPADPRADGDAEKLIWEESRKIKASGGRYDQADLRDFAARVREPLIPCGGCGKPTLFPHLRCHECLCAQRDEAERKLAEVTRERDSAREDLRIQTLRADENLCMVNAAETAMGELRRANLIWSARCATAETTIASIAQVLGNPADILNAIEARERKLAEVTRAKDVIEGDRDSFRRVARRLEEEKAEVTRDHTDCTAAKAKHAWEVMQATRRDTWDKAIRAQCGSCAEGVATKMNDLHWQHWRQEAGKYKEWECAASALHAARAQEESR
jgi:hypothetical protein